MFEFISRLFKPAHALTDMAIIIDKLSELLELFAIEKFKEGESGRNAAIDAIIEILQKEKR